GLDEALDPASRDRYPGSSHTTGGGKPARARPPVVEPTPRLKARTWAGCAGWREACSTRGCARVSSCAGKADAENRERRREDDCVGRSSYGEGDGGWRDGCGDQWPADRGRERPSWA